MGRSLLLLFVVCLVTVLANEQHHEGSAHSGGGKKVNLPPTPSPLSADSKAKLEKLAALKEIYESGYIGKAEYEARKNSLVDELTGTTKGVQVPAGNGTVYSAQLKFLLNQLYQGLPRSYADVLPTGESFWTTSMYLDIGAIDPFGNQVPLDSEIAIQERTLTRYGLNLYDGATWQIALALEGLADLAVAYESNILYPSSTGANANIGGIVDIRSDTPDYLYGSSQIAGADLPMITLPGNVTRVLSQGGNPTTETSQKQAGALFYRMIGPKYFMTDPYTGDYANAWKYPYPNNDTTTPWNIAGLIHFNDWKPITGENVWAAITGPLQVLWITNGTKITPFTTFATAPNAVQLAISILPALWQLRSPLGPIYHCPKGTQMFPPDPSEETNVSNENNFSAYAALTMLHEILVKFSPGATDPVLVDAKTKVVTLLQGLDSWFAKSILSEPYQGSRVVYQGGHVSFGGVFTPVPISLVGGFAVDCQTWGMTVLGQKKVDQYYGAGTAYNIWQATKKFAGYFNPQGKLGGVGYTIVNGSSSNMIWSAEWTWGAIYACEKLAHEYTLAGRADYAASLTADAQSMVDLVTQPMVRCKNGAWCGGGLVQEDGSYVYANSRFFIPWGWYANPVGATCSTAWAIMHSHKYNPFILGGGYVSPIPVSE